MGQTAPSHFGVECIGGLFKQVSAIPCNVQKFIVTQACVSLAEARIQGYSTVSQLTRNCIIFSPAGTFQ